MGLLGDLGGAVGGVVDIFGGGSKSKSKNPQIPEVYRKALQQGAMPALERRFQERPTQYMAPLTAPASPFELAALGNIANLAMFQAPGLAMPKTSAAAFGGANIADVLASGAGGGGATPAAPAMNQPTAAGGVPMGAGASAGAAPDFASLLAAFGGGGGGGAGGGAALGAGAGGGAGGGAPGGLAGLANLLKMAEAGGVQPWSSVAMPGQGISLDFLGENPAFNPYARLPAAAGFIPPAVASMFRTAPMSLMLPQPWMADSYVGQQAEGEAQRAKEQKGKKKPAAAVARA